MNPTRRRILFIATDLSTGGGVNKIIRDLAVLFRDRLAADVTVVNARSDRPSSYDFPADVFVESHRRQSLLGYLLVLWRLRRSHPDVVVSSWAQDNILVTLAFLFSSTKVVLVEHSSWDFHGTVISWLRRLVYPLASEVIVLNRRDLDYHGRYLSNVHLIPDPVMPPIGANHDSREKLVLAVGHLSALKNFGDAVRAMAESKLEQVGWSLAIIGSGAEEPVLRKLVEQLGLGRTHIYAEEEDLARWYARASLLLVTSRLESFSLVLAEAMASGVVPIAYDSAGPSYILEDFPEQLVTIGDVHQLARRLAAQAASQDIEALRERLKRSIETRFSPDVVAAKWERLLN